MMTPLTDDELDDIEVMARSIESIHPTFGGNVLRLLAEYRRTRSCIVSRETSDVSRRVPRWSIDEGSR
jgi:hypothetical protein